MANSEKNAHRIVFIALLNHEHGDQRAWPVAQRMAKDTAASEIRAEEISQGDDVYLEPESSTGSVE